MSGQQKYDDPPLQPGSRSSFERAYSMTYDRLIQSMTGVLGSKAAAEDCVQEAFTRAWRRWADWRPDRPVEVWLHRITLNVAREQLRRGRVRLRVDALLRHAQPVHSDEPAVSAELRDAMRLLSRLSTRDRAIVMLRHFHGYSTEEISRSVGISDRAVRARLQKVRSTLAEALSEGPSASDDLSINKVRP